MRFQKRVFTYNTKLLTDRRIWETVRYRQLPSFKKYLVRVKNKKYQKQKFKN
jgi:hypothetical protein